jgi:hypothetical protein
MLAMHGTMQSHAFMRCNAAIVLRVAGSLTGPAATAQNARTHDDDQMNRDKSPINHEH